MIAIFGGSFDPPHIGHQSAVLRLLNMPEVDGVMIIPCYEHRFGKQLTPFADRLSMCGMAFRIFNNVEINDVEAHLDAEGSMIETIKHLRKEFECELGLAIGTDNYRQRERWDRFDELSRLVRIIVLERPAESVSSTRIRELLRQGRDASASAMLPGSVANYIHRYGLYSNTE
jgi:nicotinate-nucleotide adenylyltransferase